MSNAAVAYDPTPMPFGWTRGRYKKRAWIDDQGVIQTQTLIGADRWPRHMLRACTFLDWIREVQQDEINYERALAERRLERRLET